MPDFPKIQVVNILIESGAITKWEILYDALIKGEAGKKMQLKSGFSHGSEIEYNLLSEIVTLWISQTGENKATVPALVQVLVNIGLQSSAEKLAKAFGLVIPDPPVASASQTVPLVVQPQAQGSNSRTVKAFRRFPTSEVVAILSKSKPLIKKWAQLFHWLKIIDEEETLSSLQRGENNGNIQAVEIFTTLMEIWVEQQGRNNATIPNLVIILRDNLLNAVADDLDDFVAT